MLENIGFRGTNDVPATVSQFVTPLPEHIHVLLAHEIGNWPFGVFSLEFAHLLVRTECFSSAGRHGLRFYFQDPKF